MKIKLDLIPNSFLNVKQFRDKYPIANLDDISNFIIGSQVVPKIYLSKNSIENEISLISEDESDFSVLAISGYSLAIFSFPTEIVFILMELNNLVNTSYDPSKSFYYPFLSIPRCDILRYEKVEEGSFYGIKQKKSLNFAVNASKMGVGRGLLPSLLMKGIINMIDRNEVELELMTGTKYLLYYKENLTEKKIEIIGNQLMINSVDEFFQLNWNIIQPKVDANTSEGCYIATCCYNSYNHPSVLILRNFRDTFLLRKRFGRNLVSIYYKYSPRFAQRLNNYPTLNKALKLVFFNPLVFLLRIIYRPNKN